MEQKKPETTKPHPQHPDHPIHPDHPVKNEVKKNELKKGVTYVVNRLFGR